MSRRIAVLANGDRVPLSEAADWENTLRGALEFGDDNVYDTVHNLREMCLGREIKDGPRNELIQLGWIYEGGEVQPSLKSVVLSAIRGVGNKLRFEHPYTDDVDQALATFVTAREELLGKLDDKEHDALFQPSGRYEDLKMALELKAEDQERENRGLPPLPKDDALIFLSRLRKRREQQVKEGSGPTGP